MICLRCNEREAVPEVRRRTLAQLCPECKLVDPLFQDITRDEDAQTYTVTSSITGDVIRTMTFNEVEVILREAEAILRERVAR